MELLEFSRENRQVFFVTPIPQTRYGIMYSLGEKSDYEMEERQCKEKVSEVLTMLKLSNKYPEYFKYKEADGYGKGIGTV